MTPSVGSGGASCRPEEAPAGTRKVEVLTLEGKRKSDFVIEEVPAALVYNGISHTVMMVTPDHLEDFALGFSLAEGIVRDLTDVYDIEVHPGCSGGFEVRLEVSSESFWKLKERRRSMAGRTGCGICGTESLSEVVRLLPPLPFTQRFDLKHYAAGLAGLAQTEVLRSLTGGTHSAVWVTPDGQAAFGREDVGRHVALDKLLGCRARTGCRQGALFVSSRASYEMVQKAAACGVEILFAVSAPTALAVKTAQKCRLTLAAFCRENKANIYTHPERLIGLP